MELDETTSSHVAMLILSRFFLKYPMKMKQSFLTETKLFHFQRVSKMGGRGGDRANPFVF